MVKTKKRIAPVLLSTKDTVSSNRHFARKSPSKISKMSKINKNAAAYKKYENMSKEDLIEMAIHCEEYVGSQGSSGSDGLKKYQNLIESDAFLNKYKEMDRLEKALKEQKKANVERSKAKNEEKKLKALQASQLRSQKKQQQALLKELRNESQKRIKARKQEEARQRVLARSLKKKEQALKKEEARQRVLARSWKTKEQALKREWKNELRKEKEARKMMKKMMKKIKIKTESKTTKQTTKRQLPAAASTNKTTKKIRSTRCPRGTRRNQKTGLCEPFVDKK